MKQLLKSLRRIKYIVVGATVVIFVTTVVVLLFNNSKRKEIDDRLSELMMITKFNDAYLRAQLAEEKALKLDSDFFKGLIDGVTGNEKYELTSLDDIKGILKEYPGGYDEALQREDIYSVAFGFPLFGQDLWDKFVSDCRLGRPGNIIMVQFSADFECFYYFIEYDGSQYHVVEDRSRGSEDEESGYSECYGRYLKVEQYVAEAGYAEYAFVTDDAELTYKDIDVYYHSEDVSEMKEPTFWGFYVGVVTEEMMANAMLSNDEGSEVFASEYSGYADRHPNFFLDNLRMDYDGDGILDRVYREYFLMPDGNEVVYVYLFLGNGENIVLSKNDTSTSMNFRTYVEDNVESDNPDIVFEEYDEDIINRTVFEYQDGNYVVK